LEPDGSLDPTFPLTLTSDWGPSASVAPDGRILAYGAFNQFAGEPRASLARLNPDGSLDPEFVSPFLAHNAVSAVAHQADGKLIVTGSFLECGGEERVRLARLEWGSPIPGEIRFQPGTISHEADAGFRARVAAPPGQLVVGERSEDLQSWVRWVTNTMPPTGVVELFDPTTTATRARFYRAAAP
jgi:ribosomal protein L34